MVKSFILKKKIVKYPPLPIDDYDNESISHGKKENQTGLKNFTKPRKNLNHSKLSTSSSGSMSLRVSICKLHYIFLVY